MAMPSEPLCMTGQKDGSFAGNHKMCHEINHDCQNCFSSSQDKNINSSLEEVSSLCYAQNVMEEGAIGGCNFVNIEADFVPESKKAIFMQNLKNDGNADDGSNAGEFEVYQRQQRGNLVNDLYNQEHFDDDYDEDDDSDWEPLNHLVMKKWFCGNCTMPNFDDVCQCEVCGEPKESEIFGHETFKSYFSNGTWNSLKHEALQRFQGLSSTTCTAIGFDERMLLHHEVVMKSHPHPERPDRLKAIAAGLAAAGIFPGKCFLIPAREILPEELLKVHATDHIEAVQHSSCFLSSYFTADTYANEHSALAARIAAGLCADLAISIISGKTSNGFALVRPPGHHAGVRQAMGFCLHNNAAVAALAAQTAGANKVLIVDWDVHHGNGTQEIFEQNKSVLYISLHRHENGRFYPGTGAADEVGIMDGKGFSVNIPWSQRGVGDDDYIYAFQHIVLPIASEFAPDITIVSAGFDAARGDPLGGCDVTPGGYAQMAHMLTSLSRGKLMVILEGGYNLRSISSSATAVVKVLLGEIPGYDISNIKPSQTCLQSVLQVLKIQLKYWPILESNYDAIRSQWKTISSTRSCRMTRQES
ncbi:Histone deacetylase 15 [Apostasia shenzhenica]|uniref:histone deacetylase n=1 Tax=Apostasia shenzhenica TaxID=1088818 RepID=A0A2I0ANG2_9ASPA|nr:Histone deacetylase 15 [Apostasia shenzhenica]